MPRDLPLGNGTLLITFDSRYQLRDVYFPHVGQEDHTIGGPCRFGVWADGAFSWTGDDGWQRDLRYLRDTLVSDVTLEHAGLGLRLACRDAVDLDRNVFLREVRVTDRSGAPRDVRLFLHFDARLTGNELGDSAFYDPRTGGIVHFKTQRYILISGQAEGGRRGLASFAIGQKARDGHEGTWRDAEDGVLSRNPAAQGTIDSVGQLDLRVPAGGAAVATFWLAAGRSYAEVREIDRVVEERGPESFLSRTEHYWRLWANNDQRQVRETLPPRIADLCRRSALIVRTQTDDRGAITAGNDSDVLRFNRDTYSYLWPRDGALVAAAMDQAGYIELPRRFFALCGELITEEGYLLHKYNPDGSPGSSWHAWSTREGTLELPIQEDETGLPLWALWRHYDRQRDIEFVRPLYRTLVRPAAEFMTGFREPRTRLPAASYDLWEERRGIHAFTTAAVWAGLVAAERFAAAFGQRSHAARYGQAAAEIRSAAIEHLYDPALGRFVRTLRVLDDGTVQRDPTIDISLAGLWMFGMLAPGDPRIVATMRAVEERLWVRTAIGGIARYEDDRYMQVSRDLELVPGNPWCIGTLWLAEHHIERAATVEDLGRALELLEWCAARALPSGVLPEQVHPYTGDPISVAPLTWSHATFISAAQRYARRAERLTADAQAQLVRAGEILR